MSIPDASPATHPPAHRHWYRLALVATVVLVMVVLALLPIAVRSMQEVLGRGADPLFDLLTGDVVSTADVDVAETGATYVNLGLVDLAPDTGLVTIAVSGNRSCDTACPTLTLTFAALDDDADQRRGLPPSATLTLGPTDRLFSQAVQLPVRGQPSLYPFDQYHLWLGVGGTITMPDGTSSTIDPGTLVQHSAVATLQNRIPDMLMTAPVSIPPEQVRTRSDPFPFLAVQELTLEQPAYLKVLAVVLVLLIAISATLALFTRGIDELALGFGGIILGVWGVRSVLMPHSIGTVTAIDLALSWLILLLLLGLALRAAVHFLHRSELPLSRRR